MQEIFYIYQDSPLSMNFIKRFSLYFNCNKPHGVLQLSLIPTLNFGYHDNFIYIELQWLLFITGITFQYT